mmetsp:Transcript_18567/g.30944  ORF Transcript_18567/g.30944 Transcript_18567/m.30944 type:complete len:88 (+) Transcript_18567:1221-1484(+)
MDITVTRLVSEMYDGLSIGSVSTATSHSCHELVLDQYHLKWSSSFDQFLVCSLYLYLLNTVGAASPALSEDRCRSLRVGVYRLSWGI